MEINKFYKLRVVAGTQILHFTAKILFIKDGFISFKDRNGEIFNYNLNAILDFSEVRE